MAKKPDIIQLDKNTKARLKDEIIRYFSEERDEEIGDLKAEMILDFVSEKLGPSFYNKGLQDAMDHMSTCVDDMKGMEKY